MLLLLVIFVLEFLQEERQSIEFQNETIPAFQSHYYWQQILTFSSIPNIIPCWSDRHPLYLILPLTFWLRMVTVTKSSSFSMIPSLSHSSFLYTFNRSTQDAIETKSLNSAILKRCTSCFLHFTSTGSSSLRFRSCRTSPFGEPFSNSPGNKSMVCFIRARNVFKCPIFSTRRIK